MKKKWLILVLILSLCGLWFSNHKYKNIKSINTKVKPYIINNDFSKFKKNIDLKNFDINSSEVYKQEKNFLNNEIKNAQNKLNVNSLKQAKIAVLNKNLTEILYKINVKISSVSFSPFLIDDIKLLRPHFSKSDYFCNSEFSSKETHLDLKSAAILVSPEAKEGCYSLLNGEYKKTTYKPKKRTYDITKTIYKFNNYGNRYNLNVELLKKQKINLVIVDKVFAHYFQDTMQKIKKNNIAVILVNTNNPEAEIAAIEVLGDNLSHDNTSVAYYLKEYTSSLWNLIDLYKPLGENQPKDKVLLVHRRANENYILKNNSYLAWWFEALGFEVVYPKGDQNLTTDRIKASKSEIARYSKDVKFVINSLHPIKTISWYETKDKNWNHKYRKLDSINEAKLDIFKIIEDFFTN